MDMSKLPFANSVPNRLHDAEKKIVFDRYHVMRHMGTALDTVRKAEHREFRAQGSSKPLTGSKYLWLYSSGEPCRKTPGAPSKPNLLRDPRTFETARAWAIKESLPGCSGTT